MTAQQLRNSILQQAIQGRLVPQDPSEGSADVLLSAIRQKKELLYKSKKISKRDFEVSEIQEDEIPFDIPESWAWIRIGEIFKHSTGKSLNEANRKGNPHEYITTSNVFWNRFELKKLRQMYYTDEELDKCQAEPGDLLVLEGGDVGRAAVWNKDYKICLQNHIHKLHPYEPLDVYFYYYCFFLYHDMGLIGGKGIGIQGLSSGALHNIVFPLPPLAEQRRIVAKIEELMPLVEKYGKAQTELDTLNQDLPRRLRQSVLQQAIQGKLVEQDEKDEPASVLLERIRKEKEQLVKEGKLKKKDLIITPIADDEKPFDIPSGWEWCNLGNILSIVTGKKDANQGCENGPYPFFTCSMTPIRSTTYSFEGEAILLPGNGANVGMSILYDGKFEVYQRTYVLQSLCDNCLFLPYIKLALDWNWKQYNDDKLYGSAIPYIKLSNLQNYIFPLPPLAEQRRIVAKIEKLFAEIDKLK